MAFFDELGGKIDKFGQEAYQKTKNTADVVKLSSNAQNEEKKLLGLYQELGKQYASKYPENYETDFAQVMHSINGTKAEIDRLNAQINELKGRSTCTACGAAIAPGARFCTNCGAPAPVPQTKAPAGDVLFCTNCGMKIQPGAKFCTGCGAKIAAPTDPVEPVMYGEPVAPVEPAVNEEPSAPVEEVSEAADLSVQEPVASESYYNEVSPEESILGDSQAEPLDGSVNE